MKETSLKVIGAPKGGTSGGGGIKTINGAKPDASGNINVATMTDADKAKLDEALKVVDTIDATVQNMISAPVDDSALPLLCGQPPILFGAGTPQEAVVPVNWKQFDAETGEGYNWNGEPSAISQQYINTSVSTGGRYIAVPSADGGLTWKNF